jgi:hypothetical protein
MNKCLLGSLLAAALLAVSQQDASAWFNLYAGGAASISWGPPHCAYFANKASQAAPAAAPAAGYAMPAVDAGYPAYGAYPGYGDGLSGYGGFSGYGNPTGVPSEPSKSWTAPVPTPLPSGPAAPKSGGGAGSAQPETAGFFDGAQSAGYSGGYLPINTWNNNYQGGYQPPSYPPGNMAGYYQGGTQPLNYPPANYGNYFQGAAQPATYPPANYGNYYQGGYQPSNSYDYSGYGSYQAPSWDGR